jgi:hypothetical protein
MKRNLLAFFFLLFFSPLFSQVVTYEQARETAVAFFKDKDYKKNDLKSASRVVVDSLMTVRMGSFSPLKSATAQAEPAFYIFNRQDSPGFVVVSGEKKITGILAWSDNNRICGINPSQQWLFDQYVGEIALSKSLNVSSLEIVQPDLEVLEPLLRKIEWNQTPAPYNSYCPFDPLTRRTCPVGCVATALAQVIYYFKYPRIGTGSVIYASKFGVMSVNFASAEYNYEGMSDQPPTGVLNPDIAQLCFHSGVSLETDYGPYESSAFEGNIVTALTRYFKYKQPTLRYLNNYSFDAWKAMINKEIVNNRPVIYGALDPLDPAIPDDVAGGHVFVLDGFTNEDQYHINWGWGGCSNGFYRLNLLTPANCGDIYTFSDQHMMITGIEPATTFECLMSVSKDSLQFEVGGGSRTVNISSNTNWYVLEDAPWINVSVLSGSGTRSLTITTASNEGFLDRNAEIKLTGCDDDRIIRVEQKGTCSLSLSDDTLIFPVLEGKKKIGISSTASWMISANEPWITVFPGLGSGKDSLTVSVTDNMGSSRRQGTITVFGCNSSKTISVMQNGTCSLDISGNDFEFTSDSVKQEITVVSGTSWQVTSHVSWATVFPASSDNSGKFTIFITQNISGQERTGIITVKGCNDDKTITVTQKGVCYMDLAALNVDFDPDGGDKFLKVRSNSTWQAGTETCWIIVTPTRGNEDDYLKIEVLPNTSQSVRSGYIDLTGCNFSRKITVIQQCYCPLDVTSSLLDFTYYSGTKSASIISTGAWTVTADAPWITVTPSSGNKVGSFNVSVQINTGTSKRSGNITVSGCYTSRNVEVTQDICSYSVSDQKLVFTHDQGQKSLNIKSNSAWTASSDSRWCAVSPSFGTENTTLSVFADANPLPRRKAVVTITGCFSHKEVEINQEGDPTPVTSVNQGDLKVFPSPTDRFVKIELPSGTAGWNLEVYSETGQKILAKQKLVSGDEIDMKGLAGGLYCFRLRNPVFMEIRKVILK